MLDVALKQPKPPTNGASNASTPPIADAPAACPRCREGGVAMAARAPRGTSGHRLILPLPAPVGAGLRPGALTARVLDSKVAQRIVRNLLAEATEGRRQPLRVAGALTPDQARERASFVQFIEQGREQVLAHFARAMPEPGLRDLAQLRGTKVGRLVFDWVPMAPHRGVFCEVPTFSDEVAEKFDYVAWARQFADRADALCDSFRPPQTAPAATPGRLTAAPT